MSSFGDDDSEGYDEYEDDFIDDEEDDDDDDEDYGGGKKSKKSGKRKLAGAKSKKKQKKKKRSGMDFIQMEAEEDEEEENSDDDEISPEERKMAEQRRLQEQNKLKRRTEGPGILEFADNEEELHNYLRSTQMHEVAEDTELGLLPTSADPKLFFVKCVPGEERDICYQIMKKYFDYLGTDAEFEIFSASCVEKIKGQIYIEAFTDKHIYMAIANIPKVFGKASLVNFADRTLIFEPDPRKNVQAKIGQWVRIKRGLYEGDLAQVTDIDELKARVEVRLVPRLMAAGEVEDEKDEDAEKGPEDQKNKRMENLAKMRAAARSKIKPPQKLFQENEYQNWQYQRDLERGMRFISYMGNRYLDGLLYKWFPIKNLITENINVTYDESKFFTSGESADPDMLSTLINQVGSKPTKFFKGDRVKVIKGDLMNLEAIIRNINQDTLTLEPVGTDFVEVLEIAPGDCVKAFPKGAYVRVVEGKNAGKEGFVLSVDDSNIATLMSDGLQNVIQVFVNDLVFCNEATRTIDVSTSKGKDQQDFVKFDLVKLNDRKTVGIILGTSNAGWRILDNFGNVRSVSVYQIEQKLNTRNNMTKNDKNQTLRLNDSVTIRQGRYKGQTGIIKHIYNDLLFIYNPEVDQNNGAIIEKANNTYLLSSQRATSGKPSGPKVKDNLLGQKCVIKAGAWKGYQGLVKDANDKTVRLELTAKCKIIDVKRELVIPLSEVGKTPETVHSTALEPKTPMINRFPQSPMFNMASPGFETSPAWAGFESPAYNQHL